MNAENSRPITATMIREANRIFREAMPAVMRTVVEGWVNEARHQHFLDSFQGPDGSTRELEHKVAALLDEFSVENPPPYSRIRDLIENHGLSPIQTAWLLLQFLMPQDSTLTGQLEGITALRSETDPDDPLGADTDGDLGMGEAESWFRKRTGRGPGRPAGVQADFEEG